MARINKPDPYEGFQNDLKIIKLYFKYLYTIIGLNPEAARALAKNIREHEVYIPKKGD